MRCVLSLWLLCFFFFLFFFQAEDGIRDHCVTGVQTCALPIFRPRNFLSVDERTRNFALSEMTSRSVPSGSTTLIRCTLTSSNAVLCDSANPPNTVIAKAAVSTPAYISRNRSRDANFIVPARSLLPSAGYPGHPVHSRRQLDRFFQFPSVQIQYVNFPCARAAQIRDVAPRANQNLRRSVRDFQPARNFHGL